MKILFVNNTKNLKNIGCQMTSQGLEILLQGHEVENFFAEEVFSINQRLNGSPLFKILALLVGKSSDLYLLMVKEYILFNNKNLVKFIDENNVVLINGEGSIHHNKVTGIVLVAVASLAKDRGKTVHLVNSTLQSLSPVQIREIKRLDRIVVRELYSKNFLLEHGVPSVLGADAAWIFLNKNFSDLRLLGQKSPPPSSGLVTLGVSPNLEEAREKMSTLTLETDYLLVDDADSKNTEYIGGEFKFKNMIEARTIIQDPTTLVRRYGQIITGRHHIAILAYFLGVPVSTIRSNTYKIESTIFSIKGSILDKDIILTDEELRRAIDLAHKNFSV